jgi:hypothetical protein
MFRMSYCMSSASWRDSARARRFASALARPKLWYLPRVTSD